MNDKRYLCRYLQDMEAEKAFVKEEAKESYRARRAKEKGPCHCIVELFATVEVFIANMPLTIGALGLSWVTMGVVWWKFMEENIDACTPVHFNSPMCTFPEFPGCFECDTSNLIYRVALRWHLLCNLVGFVCCVLFCLKVVVAWRVVIDDLRNPTTSTPMGVVCITMVCVSAGRGPIGELGVLMTSIFHFFLAFWFLHTAVNKYHLWPDPGWFPNTVGISYAAIKTWLYFPLPGKFLMALCSIFFFSTYFISLYRVATNTKIALPICYIQLSAPSITLYAITILSQPSRQREMDLEADPYLMRFFFEVHKDFYLPIQHCMLFLTMVGMASVVHATHVRWRAFIQKEFSPAHIALVFPILSHTNAIQAYRSGVDAFSTIPSGSPYKMVVFVYWSTFLFGGTLLCLGFTYHYVKRLPQWTKIMQDQTDDGEDEELYSLLEQTMAAHGKNDDCTDFNIREISFETMDDPFAESIVSPAVLQANEVGSLVRVRRGTKDFEKHGPYKRTRKVSSHGFDPVLSAMELELETTRLLEHVAKTRPRRRHRTLSNQSLFLRLGIYDNAIDNEASALLPIHNCDNQQENNYDALESGNIKHQRSKTVL